LRQREPELDEDEALRIVRGGLLYHYREQRKWQNQDSPL
jgi:hypothetical protein